MGREVVAGKAPSFPVATIVCFSGGAIGAGGPTPVAGRAASWSRRSGARTFTLWQRGTSDRCWWRAICGASSGLKRRSTSARAVTVRLGDRALVLVANGLAAPGSEQATARTPRDAGLCRAQPIMVPCGRWATNLTHARNSSAIEGGSAASATTPWRLFMIQR
jgi:hypothetical protein